MSACAAPGCTRDALTSRHPAITFARCLDHTGRAMAEAFGGDVIPVAFPANGQHSDSPRSTRLVPEPPSPGRFVARSEGGREAVSSGARGTG